MTLLHPTDGCPACITQHRTTIVWPSAVSREGRSLTASYDCPQCGNHWSCSWSTEQVLGVDDYVPRLFGGDAA